jgi:hypothetical protein
VIGPAWEAAADIQDGDYGSAAFNGAMAVADALPIGPVMKLRKLTKVLEAANKGRPLSSLSAREMSALYRDAGLKGPGQDLHHTIPLKAWKILPRAEREAAGVLRNNPALLKVMDPATHRKAHAKHTGFNLPSKVWHGSNALEKSAVGAVVGKTADAREARTERPRPILDPNRPLEVKRTEQGFTISNRNR